MVTVVRGVVKDYGWGIVDGLAPWCGGATGLPQAELWFGAHSSGPSPIVGSSGQTHAAHLGELFDSREVPLLVKLLAAGQPLSVQVHPKADLARRRWHDQQSAGAPQILADANEKTELLVAIEPFEAFVGWRPVGEAAAVLARIPSAAAAAELLMAGDRIAAIRSLLAADGLAEAVALLPQASVDAGLPAIECSAYETVATTYPGDRGALLTALLAHVSLDIGSAIYVPAGVPHSYIRGLGLEVMTTSDNVLRLGLTPKPIFADEAIEALDLDSVPQVLRRVIGETIAPQGAPFEALLGRGLTGAGAAVDADAVAVAGAGADVDADADAAANSADARQELAALEILCGGRFRLCLAIEGTATVTTDAGSVVLSPGSAAVISREESAARVSSSGLVALVTDC